MISLAPCSSIKGPPVIPPLRLQERSATDEGEGEFPLFLLVREEKEPREVANNQRLVFQMRFTSHGDENRCRITLTDTFEDRRVNKYRKCVFLPPGPVERNSTFLLPPGCKTMGDGLLEFLEKNRPADVVFPEGCLRRVFAAALLECSRLLIPP
jgi:hypothetical protein